MDLEILRHSVSHVLAHAVKSLWPDVKLGIGPAIADGFYYDFDKKEPFLPEDLEKIEKKMREIIAKDYPFVKKRLNKNEAVKLFEKLQETYKAELLEEIAEDKVTIYEDGDFIDLCRGPHVESTGKITAFKLLSVAGAYWRGSEKNPMLQRIYGTAFSSEKDLKKYLQVLEEAKKRDHRKLGKELELFLMDDTVGAGLVIYQPKGALLRNIIEDWEKKEHIKRGYQMVLDPHIMKSDIWVRSGHYDFYKEHMYIFKAENAEYAVKPMNCPGHMLAYKSKGRSYKDLPIRYFELGTVYRHEKSGVLHGLLRVRGFTQDDAHIFCLPEQLVSEIGAVIDFVIETLKIFGFDEYAVELSTRPEGSIGTDEDWERATTALQETLKVKNIKYAVNESEGAFYGPKIDIELKDAIGRSWQCATIQCDFALPERFDLTYKDRDGKDKRPVMLHRVILGSMERFVGALIEHYAGAFPVWLSPVQVVVASITDKQADYAKQITRVLRESVFRADTDDRNETIGYKIREWRKQKIPYMIIVGPQEEAKSTVSVRSRAKGDEGSFALPDFQKRLGEEVNSYQ